MGADGSENHPAQLKSGAGAPRRPRKDKGGDRTLKAKKDALRLGLGGAMVFSAVCATAGYLMRVAMDREAPASMKRMMRRLEGRKKAAAPSEHLSESQEKLKNAPHETITVIAHDGARLTGHWFPVKDQQRVILAVHGWRSAWWRDFGLTADFWRSCGCSVLYIEQRGQGQSEGEYIGFGLLEREDLSDWIEWITARCGEEAPVYLAGISMGATTVLMAADAVFPGNVRGIMADCGFTSPEAIWRHVAVDNLHLPYRMTPFLAEQIFRRKVGMSPDARSTVDALKNSRYPVLFVHGEADSFVPIEMTYDNFAACTSQKRILTVPGAEHGMSYLLAKEAYEEAEKSFWQEFDEGKEASAS